MYIHRQLGFDLTRGEFKIDPRSTSIHHPHKSAAAPTAAAAAAEETRSRRPCKNCARSRRDLETT